MKKTWNLIFTFSTCLMLAGCSSKFEPTESTLYVTSKGEVKSALMESFEKPYYDFDELLDSVEKEVKTYNLDKNEEVISVESLTKGVGDVTLIMNYQNVDTYTAFNEVLLFHGTYAEALLAGYEPIELYDVEGVSVPLDSEKLEKMKVVVTEESVCIQTSGKVRYVSDNVTIVDKKIARALEAGKSHPAFILYK